MYSGFPSLIADEVYYVCTKLIYPFIMNKKENDKLGIDAS
jgi:hypothetical protein